MWASERVMEKQKTLTRFIVSLHLSHHVDSWVSVISLSLKEIASWCKRERKKANSCRVTFWVKSCWEILGFEIYTEVSLTRTDYLYNMADNLNSSWESSHLSECKTSLLTPCFSVSGLCGWYVYPQYPAGGFIVADYALSFLNHEPVCYQHKSNKISLCIQNPIQWRTQLKVEVNWLCSLS